MRKSQLLPSIACLLLLPLVASLEGSWTSLLQWQLQTSPPTSLCHQMARHLDRLGDIPSEPQLVALLTSPESGARLSLQPVVLLPEWLPPWPWSPQLLSYVRARVVQQVRDYLWQPMQQAYYSMWPGGGQTSRKPSSSGSTSPAALTYEPYQLLLGPWAGGNFSLSFGLAFNTAFNIRGNVQASKKQQSMV